MDPRTMTSEPQDALLPALRLVGAYQLILDRSSGVLLLHHRAGDTWSLPGGEARQGEDAWAAAVRLSEHNTGLLTFPQRLLVVDFNPTVSAADGVERYDFVFDGGRWPDGRPVTLPVAPSGGEPPFEDWRFVHPDEVDRYLDPHQAGRVETALSAGVTDARFLIQGWYPEDEE